MQLFLIAHHDHGWVRLLKEVQDLKSGPRLMWTSINSKDAMVFKSFDDAATFFEEHLQSRTKAYIYAVEV